MDEYIKVLNYLEEQGIEYNLVEHPPALTTEEADRYIEGIEGVRTKTLFLCNRKKTVYYLVVMDDGKRIEMKVLGDILEEKGMQFGSADRLKEKMGLEPGIVSIFGLLNNETKDIKVVIDEEITGEKYMSFHVNDNSKTAFITTVDMYKFIEACGFQYRIVRL